MLRQEYLWSGVPQGDRAEPENVYLSPVGVTESEPPKEAVKRAKAAEETFLRLLTPGSEEVKLWA
jgi:hypothetical protein